MGFTSRIRNPFVVAFNRMRERREMRHARMSNTRVMTDPVAFNVFAVGFIVVLLMKGISGGFSAMGRHSEEGHRRAEAMIQRRQQQQEAAVPKGGEAEGRG